MARLLTPFPSAPAAPLSAGTALCPQPCSSPFRALFSLSSLLIRERILRMTCRRCVFPSMPPRQSPCPAEGLRSRPRADPALKSRRAMGVPPRTGQTPALGGLDRAVKLLREGHDLFIRGLAFQSRAGLSPPHKSLSTRHRCPSPAAWFSPHGRGGQSSFPLACPKRPVIISVAQRGSPFAGQQFISPLTQGELHFFALCIWNFNPRISNFSQEN